LFFRYVVINDTGQVDSGETIVVGVAIEDSPVRWMEDRKPPGFVTW